MHEQEAVLGVLKYLDEDAKRYLLLHQTTSGLDAMLKGLQFYDEQLRVLTFQKEHHHGNLNAFRARKGDKGDKGKGEKGKKGKGDKGKGKGDKGKAKVNELTKPTRGTRRTSLERVPRRVPRERPRRLTCATTVARKGIGPATAG